MQGMFTLLPYPVHDPKTNITYSKFSKSHGYAFPQNQTLFSREFTEKNSAAKVILIVDNLVLKQKRVKFSGSRRDKQEEESEGIRERRESPSPQLTELLKEENKVQRPYFSSQMSQDYDAREIDFATAVAAAAFAVHLLGQAGLQHQRRKQEDPEISRSKVKGRKDEITTEVPTSSRATRLFSNKEAKSTGEVWMKRSLGGEDNKSARPSPAKQLSRALSAGQGTSRESNGVESKADAWEKVQMKEVQSRYEKTKSAILAWENEKKMHAKVKMEKRKKLLEQRRGQNMQRYQIKVARIEQIAGGARAQLEEKRRNEELEVKDKAKEIRSGGNVPVKCFCFTC